jgi:hypothetical protein
VSTQIVCDACDQPIDEMQAYFVVTASKLQLVASEEDPSAPPTLTAVEPSVTLHYHDGHQPSREGNPDPEPEPEPEPEPGAELISLDPATVVQNGGDVQVTVHGSGFNNDTAVIVFDAVPVATAFVDVDELFFTVNASVGGHAVGTFDVLVRQDGVDTAALPFTIEPAA